MRKSRWTVVLAGVTSAMNLKAIGRVSGLLGLCTVASNAGSQEIRSSSEIAGAAIAVDSSSAEQQAQAAAEKEAIVESIVAGEEARSGRAFEPVFRAGAKRALATLSASALEAQASRGGLGPKVLGDSQADLVYTPVTPCRIIDTRAVGGAIAAGTTRSFKVTGDTTTQGGANCGIPFGPATAAMVNFVAVGATAAGDLRATPFGVTMPLASILNWAGVSGLNLANGVAVALCNPANPTPCTNDVTLQADVSAIHIVADVLGYFKTTGPVLPGANLPTGSTLRGFWGQGWTATAAGEYHETYIAFGFTLASAPTAHFIPLGGTPPAGCPGTTVDPQADPGHLCVYEDNTGNTNSKNVCSSGLCPSATRWGAQLRGNSVAAGSSWMRGTWAVTAP